MNTYFLVVYQKMELPNSSVDDLLKCYSLTREKCNRVVSDAHIDEISRYYSREWKSLPPHLDIKNIVAEDCVGDPREKRRTFFFQWKQIKGSDATYLQLISALLKIKCKQDAEGVCELLQASLKMKTSGEWYLSRMMCIG